MRFVDEKSCFASGSFAFSQPVDPALERLPADSAASTADNLVAGSDDPFRQALQGLLDHSPFGVAVLNNRYEFLFFNSKLQEWTGYSPAELNGMPFNLRSGLFVPQEGSLPFSALLQLRNDRELRAEYWLQTKQHLSVPVELHAFHILANNRIEGMIVSVYDLRDDHRFRLFQGQSDLLLESLGEGVLVVRNNGVIAYMNRAFEKILSTCRSDWVGKQIFDTRMEEPVRENLRLALCGHSPRTHLMPQEFLNRRIPHLSLDILPFGGMDSAMRGALLIGRDLTAEWQWNELSKRADLIDSLSRMAASMAHEVRNPLTSLRGFLQLLSKSPQKPEKWDMYLQVMMEELERVNGIISEYLNLSRNQLAHRQPTNVAKSLNDIRALMESEAIMQGVNLRFHLADATILCDEARIKQVVINLIRNALEATPPGGFVIVSTRISDPEETVEIAVADTGAGISAELVGHIFTPFFTTKKGGTGLGLPVCKQIVEEHGGSIRVISKEGEGSCFTIRLPLSRTLDSGAQKIPFPQSDIPA